MNMKNVLIVVLGLLLLGTYVAAQCTAASPGTVCAGPLTVQPPLTGATQSANILVDIGLVAPSPAVKAYILSIGDGTIQESDNGGAYHTLVGPAGATGPTGAQGSQGPQGIPGTSVVVGK